MYIYPKMRFLAVSKSVSKSYFLLEPEAELWHQSDAEVRNPLLQPSWILCPELVSTSVTSTVIQRYISAFPLSFTTSIDALVFLCAER